MKTTDPFRYGKVIGEPFFINRTAELKRIKSDLISGNNLIIYSPRRYGKTSLIIKALKELEQENIQTLYFDFFKISSQQKFIEDFSKEILNSQSSLKKSITKFQKMVHGFKPSVSFDGQGNPSFSFSFFPDIDYSQTITEVLNLPLKFSKNKKWVIVFDEFQEIEKLNGENFEKLLRSVIQFHDNISYVFMGSKMHLLLNMFNNKERAFYKFGKLLRLDKIDKQEFKEYIVSRLNEGKFEFEENLVDELIDISDNIPYYVQFFASELWYEGLINNQHIGKQQFDKAIDNIITNQQDYFLQLLESLTNYQKKVLFALTRETKNLFSNDYATRHRLGAISSTKRALDKLVKIGIIEKTGTTLEFSDPFFPLFLKLRNFA